MPYKQIGQMIGNTPSTSNESDAPSNRASVPGGVTAQPTGTSLFSWGEGASSAGWNRPLVALGRNADYLRAKLQTPFAVARNVLAAGLPAVDTATTTDVDLSPAGSFDGWVYVGSVLGDISLYLRLLNSDGSEVRDSSGVALTVSDVQTGAGVSMVGVAQTLASGVAIQQPASTTHPRHLLTFATALINAEIGSATARGLRVAIASSAANTATKGTNNGNYVIVDGLGSGSSFLLAEFRYRVRHHSASGAYSVAETVTGGTSGATGVVVAAASDYLEFTTVSGTFRAGETITGGTSGRTATVIQFTAPGDPVVLNNDMSAAGSATITTDGTWVNGAFTSNPKVVMSGSLGGAATRILQLGSLTTLEQLGAAGFLAFGYTAPQPSLDRAYEVGRNITADLGAVTLTTTGTAEAFSIVRGSGSGQTSILTVKDGATTYAGQVFDDAAADTPDYWYAAAVCTDLIRSHTYRKASTGAVAAIGLGDASGNISLRSGESGGTMVDVLRVRKAATTTTVEQRGPTNGSLASGEVAVHSVTDQMSLTLLRSTDDIIWARASATRGGIDGGEYTSTDNYQYLSGNHAADEDLCGIVLDNVRGVAVTSEYQKRLLLTLTSCSKTFELGETITHSSGGTGTASAIGVNYLEIITYSGTWVGSGTITGGTSTATATVSALETGRSKLKVSKVTASSGALGGADLLRVVPAGGFCPPDADKQSPVLTIPDLAYANAKYLAYDVPLTLLVGQNPHTAGAWKPTNVTPAAAAIPFGMQAAVLATHDAYVPIPPYTMGVSSILLSVASITGIAVGDIVYNDTGGYWLGVVTEIGANQIRVQVTQQGVVSAGSTIKGGSTYATAFTTPDWTTTTSTEATTPVLYDAKTALVAVELSCRGSLFGGGGGGDSDRVTFELQTGTTVLDTQTLERTATGASTFSSVSILLGASVAVPSSTGDASYTVKISTPDAGWDASSWLHIQKVRAFVRVSIPNPAA